MARLNLSLLGSLQISLDGLPLTHFGAINAQGMLIYLALHAERPLSREVLAALFWPEEPQNRARANLRQNLHQLRKLLGDRDDPETPFLLVTRHDVQLNPQSDYAVDVQQFLAAIEDQDLETAVSLYHGDLLPGFSTGSIEFEAWLRQVQESLHYLGLEALSELAQEHLDNGRLEQAATIARRQLALESWREAAYRQLMLAYALAGDRANALAQYEVCRKIFQDELGLEPAAETTALFEEIKAGRFGPQAGSRDIKPPPEKRHNLPAETTAIIGREVELSQLKTLLGLENKRLVSIVGPGGMGKTHLALAAGRALLDQFSDGVTFVDLAPVEQAEEIPSAISSALRFQAPDRTQDLLSQLLIMLSQRHLLLILDNFEQLLDGTHYLSEILQACPMITLLVTSRQRLKLTSENLFELGGLSYTDTATVEEALDYSAVQLFLESGRRGHSDFVLDEANLSNVLRICRQVQGMPLGLLLAASWLDLLPPQEIAMEIETGLDFLAADLADLPPRQRSMQAMFQRSWKLLMPQEQAVLARLSIFRGGFTRQAAEEVAGANLRLLLTLVHKSLIQRKAGSGRFTMHELLRQFASGRRRPEEAIELRHCRYFAGIAKEELRRALGLFPFHLANKLPHERNNFRRAWDYALQNSLAEELRAILKALQGYNFILGIPRSELERQAINALNRSGFPENDPLMLHLRLEEVDYLNPHSEVKRQLTELLEIIKTEGDPELLFWTYSWLVHADCDHEPDEALLWSEKAVESALASGDEILQKRAQAQALVLKVNVGRQEETIRESLQELLAFFEPDFPDSFVVFNLLLALSKHALSIDDYQDALNCGNRCLNVASSWRDLGWISTAEFNLATIRLKMDRPDLAAGHVLDCLGWHLGIGERWQTLGFLYGTLINTPQLVRDKGASVSIISFVYHHPESFPSFKEETEDVLTVLEGEMESETYSEVWEKGKEIDFETAVTMLKDALEKVSSDQLKVTSGQPGTPLTGH